MSESFSNLAYAITMTGKWILITVAILGGVSFAVWTVNYVSEKTHRHHIWHPVLTITAGLIWIWVAVALVAWAIMTYATVN